MSAISQPSTVVANPAIRRQALTRRVAIGTFLGLAWGAALRAWMVLLALELGGSHTFTGAGTFGLILFPTGLVGALLGAAAYDAETSEGKRWRWAILSPLLLIVGPVMFIKNFFTILITTGMGGGAIGVALIGVSGGYAFSGFGARWTRWVSGFLALLLTIASIFPVYFAGQSAASTASTSEAFGARATSPANTSPAKASTASTSKAFGALLFVLLMVLLIVGVSAPSRYRSSYRI